MRRSLPMIALVLLFASTATSAEKKDFVPFAVDWKADVNSPADLSFLLDGPAGKDGRVRSVGGHLVRGNGKRLRLWGVNVSMAAGMPAQEHAPRIALRLAQSGVNCVRFHFFDILSPNGILDARRDDTQALDPRQLDRLDYFIAELKKRGIYTNLNLNVGHSYKPGDGVADAELLGYAKALTHFDPRLRELQREYARLLLTHRNPYTQSEYRNEPAVAIVELVNENSLVESWFSGRLLGQNTTQHPGTWTDIPASYERALTELYNAWLRKRLTAEQLADLRTEAGAPADGPILRLEPKGFAKASTLRFQTEATFYVETERQYFQDMARLLREELGVQAPLVGSSDHNHGKSGYLHLSSTSLLDIVDGHVYWQHPDYIRQGNKQTGFRIGNTPMVNEPLRSSVVQLSRSAMAGKPYTVSEVNHPFPAEFACEGIPILAAYAAFQDWDGIFWYTLAHQDPVASSPGMIGHFDLFSDPVKMSQLRAGALLFLRGDVSPARQTITRSYSREQVLESLRLSWSEAPYFTPGFDPAMPLTHAVRIQSLAGPPTTQFDRQASDPIRSDTGELTWHCREQKQGLVTMETARSQALIGHCQAVDLPTANLAVQLEQSFCAVTLQSLDGASIAESPRLLLTTCGRVANSDMQWDVPRKSLEHWGRAPAGIEPLSGSIVLRNLEGVQAVRAQPLDGAGQAMGESFPATKTAAGWKIPVGQTPTTWYVISVAR
ncbi:MAG: hypothetical protein NTY19_45860 [Planctomycetota bacterium]|nr:hypothetical protein [Planctomycetota bacterium]